MKFVPVLSPFVPAVDEVDEKLVVPLVLKAKPVVPAMAACRLTGLLPSIDVALARSLGWATPIAHCQVDVLDVPLF